MFRNKKYTISQVVNGFIVTPDFKEKLEREDLRVFNQFEDMMLYIKEKFEEDNNKIALDIAVDEITKEDHQRLKTAKENMSWVNEDIYKLGLSARIYNALRAARIDTIKELLVYSDNQLIKFKNLGKSSIKDMRQRLETYQYKWKEENDNGSISGRR
jgi:DNA-directed RNA polymerase alpha subunit